MNIRRQPQLLFWGCQRPPLLCMWAWCLSWAAALWQLNFEIHTKNHTGFRVISIVTKHVITAVLCLKEVSESITPLQQSSPDALWLLWLAETLNTSEETVSWRKPPGIAQNTDVTHLFTWPCLYPIWIVVSLYLSLASQGMMTCPLTDIVWYFSY